MKNRYILSLICMMLSTGAYAQVDYATEIQTILNNRCVSCHGFGQSGFNATSYAAVMASMSAANKYNKKHVIPGDAAGSPLVDKIEPNPQHGNQMPQGGSLSSSDINKIKDWINEGANEVATSSEEEITMVSDFKLVGNYPNPFNPTTQIRFESPTAVQYTISVYAMNGQLVSELKGNSSAGISNVELQFNNQPSGIYIYRLNAVAGGRQVFTGSGKLTLVK